jgi:hypothetical protein
MPVLKQHSVSMQWKQSFVSLIHFFSIAVALIRNHLYHPVLAVNEQLYQMLKESFKIPFLLSGII